jgi:hypothetical protein
MKFAQYSPWDVANRTGAIMAFNHTDGYRTRLVVTDIRVFLYSNHQHVVYSIQRKGHLTQFHYAALHHDPISDSIYVDNRTEIIIEHEVGRRDQKNWTPFTYSLQTTTNGAAYNILLFIYSMYPHRIVNVNETIYAGLMKANTVCSTKAIPPNTGLDTSPADKAADVSSVWSWGEPRGGTQAELVDTPYGRKYLTFFHSSGRFAVRYLQTYYMGAYLFDPEPPFAISHISPDPIAPNEFYNESFGGWAYKRRLDYIIFPMGYIIRGDTIYVTCGKNDRAGWVVTLNKTALITSLKPLASVTVVDRFREHVNYTLQQASLNTGTVSTQFITIDTKLAAVDTSKHKAK